MRIAAILCSSCLCACVQSLPLTVEATGRGHACSLRVNEVDVSHGALDLNSLRAMRANHGGRAILDTNPETPYRCIGAAVFDLQRAGFRTVAITVNGVPLPTR